MTFILEISIEHYLSELTHCLHKLQDTSRINFKNDYLEEPKLPEEGLKTRADAEYVYLDGVCQRDSKDL